MKPQMAHVPLAERVRPRVLADYVGQTHLVGPGGPIRKMLDAGSLPSMILWGPPGVGKTTLALLLAEAVKRPLQMLSAVQAGVKEVRSVLELARLEPGTILFIDEIHRFNKSQQDALLHAVEQGLVTLIGATTENPSFEVISALLSRAHVYVLNPLTPGELHHLLQRAADLVQREDGLTIELAETEAIYRLSTGDGRRALNLLELAILQAQDHRVVLTDELVTQLAQQKVARYDKTGEQHYDIISAFIKSIRGSDPDAGLYWLARMLEGGEDIRFIARRLVILASEDIGNANPNALLLATSTFQAVEMIGMPEARIILAQCVTYLATSQKSNASYVGINNALEAVRQHPDLPVPLHIRNAPTRLMKDLGYGRDYKYSHDYTGAEGNQDFRPAELQNQVFYDPKPIGKEQEIRQFLRRQWPGRYPDAPTER